MKKRCLSLFLAMLMLVFNLNITYAAQYKDIAGHWAEKEIVKWSDMGIFNGYGDGIFAPDDTITKGQIAAIMNKVMKYRVPAENKFSDLKTGEWYTDSVLKAVNSKIMQGNSEGLIKPTEKVTKQEAVLLIGRALGLDPKFKGAALVGEDSIAVGLAERDEIISYFKQLKAKNALVLGKNGEIEPEKLVTRAEIVNIMDKLVSNVYTKPVKESLGGKIFNNSVIVTSDGTDLKNATINGNLIISEGVGKGTVNLENVVVNGTAIIRGGGVNSVVISGDSKIPKIQVQTVDNELAIRFKGATSTDVLTIDDNSKKVFVYGNAKSINIGENNKVSVADGAAVKNVSVIGKNSELILLNGSKVESLNVTGSGANVQIGGTVSLVSVASKAVNVNVVVSSTANVTKFDTQTTVTAKVESGASIFQIAGNVVNDRGYSVLPTISSNNTTTKEDTTEKDNYRPSATATPAPSVTVPKSYTKENIDSTTPENVRVITDSNDLEARLVWSDEFNYTGKPAEDKWSYEVAKAGWVNNELQAYTDRLENASVANGNLTITAKKEDYQGDDYTSARIVSREKGDWLYGRFEVRAKLPAAKGVWPAIWMMPTDSGYGLWPNSGEIDTMESVYYGTEIGKVHASTHTKNYNFSIGNNKTESITPSGGSIYDDFHVYTLEWTPGKLEMLVDDQKFFSHVYEPNDQEQQWEAFPFDKRYYMIMNVAFGGNWGGAEGVDPNFTEQSMVVDYVRAYSYDLVQADNTAPTKPSNLRVENNTSMAADVVWDPSVDDNGVWYYEVYKNGKFVDYSYEHKVSLRDLQPNSSVTIAVKAVDYNGNKSAMSNTVTATTVAAQPYIVATGDNMTKHKAENYEMMYGVSTEKTADVDGGNNVGWIDKGDYMVYLIKVDTAGKYVFTGRVASKDGGQFNIDVNGTNAAKLTVPNTGDWQMWENITTELNLSAGTHKLKVYGEAFNFNWFAIGDKEFTVEQNNSEMVSNGSFDADLEGWDSGFGGGISGANGNVYWVASEAGQDGVAKIHIENTAEASAQWGMFDPKFYSAGGFRLDKSNKYEVTFKAKASQNRKMLVVVERNADPFTKHLNSNSYTGTEDIGAFPNYGVQVDLTTNWQTYTIPFTMQNTTDAQAHLVFSPGYMVGSNGAHDVFIDDVEFALVEEGGGTDPEPGLGNHTVTIDNVSLINKADANANTNLIANGDFSTGLDSNWYCGGNEGGAVSPTVTNGKLVAAITNVGDADWHVQLASQTSYKLPAGDYEISFDVSSTADRAVKVIVQNQSYYRLVDETVNVNGTFKTYTLAFTVASYDSGADWSLTIGLGKVAPKEGGTDPEPELGNHTVTIANISLINKDTNEELVVNGDFSSDLENWYCGGNEGGAVNQTVTDGELVAAITSVGSADWHVQLANQATFKLPVGEYEISFDISSTADRAVKAIVENQGYYRLVDETVNVDGTFKTYTLAFTVGSYDPGANWKMIIGLGKVAPK